MENNIHTLSIYDRANLEVSMAQEILSSTEKEIYVKLHSDILHIVGENLKINKLNPDNKTFSVSGKINGVSYVSKMSKKSIFGKVFK